MEEITERNCIEILKHRFPNFLPYWVAYLNHWNMDEDSAKKEEVIIKILPFADYVINLIKNEQMLELKTVLKFVEYAICNADMPVKIAMTESFFDYLLSKDPKEIQFKAFCHYLGEKSMTYCRSWSKLNGIKTTDNWDESIVNNIKKDQQTLHEAVIEQNCVQILMSKFPKFVRYWESEIEEQGFASSIMAQMKPLIDYVIDLARNEEMDELKKVFEFVEFLVAHGDDAVQTAITTGFLEGLMHSDREKFKFKFICRFLGVETKSYCRAYDEFTGMRTKGLWD